MEKSCDTCLFYVDAMPDLVICVAGKHVKEYTQVKTDCKRWIEDTAENAKDQLKLFNEKEGL